MKALITILFLLIAGFAVAQQPYPLSVPIPDAPAQVTDPAEYIRIIYQFGLGIGGLVAMARIIYAAIVIMTAAGNTSKISDARDMITQAIFGLVLLFGATLILYTIDPKLIKLELVKPVPVSVPAATTNARRDTMQEADRAQKEYEKDPTIGNKIKLLDAQLAAFKQILAEAEKNLAEAKKAGRSTEQLELNIENARRGIERTEKELASWESLRPL
ncbi:MAG: hypothetical protein HYT03_00300 [Candidatus Harrisonbacteria bacterium]|nr:hypothetical protein [Candidatus Harrisonbacteria bacterium]